MINQLNQAPSFTIDNSIKIENHSPLLTNNPTLDSKRPLSLREIFMSKPKVFDKVESYQMRIAQNENKLVDGEDDNMDCKTFVVTRMGVVFGGMNCELLNFKDMTFFARLNKEKALNNMLKTLNASVSHDMINTIGISIEFAQHLYEKMS